MEKRWQKTEVAYLKRHANEQTLEQLAARLNTDVTTVRDKLGELGLSNEPQRGAADPALGPFEKGLEALHAKNWKAAATAFTKVVDSSDGLQLRDRARQLLAICERELAPKVGAADPYLEAVAAKNRGDLEDAKDRCTGKKEERWVYLAASIHALGEEVEEALELLAKAIELEPKNRVHAFHDPDFAPLRGEEGFTKLLAHA